MPDSNTGSKPDDWNAQKYSGAASFVPQLTSTVMTYLDPQPSDTILDIGCGDGVLTSEIAARASSVIGLDSSPSMIATAQSTVTSQHPSCTFSIVDCADLSSFRARTPSTFTKAFSNAAMHWILRPEAARQPFFADVFALLQPGGAFVFEQGGFGNICELHAAMRAVLKLKYGIGWGEVAKADPWFFPSREWMSAALEGAGFVVERVEMEHRPTRATARAEDGSGGLEGWVRLMMVSFLRLVPEEKRDEAVAEVCGVLDPVQTKVEDGSQWLNYVRLRAVARKPAH